MEGEEDRVVGGEKLECCGRRTNPSLIKSSGREKKSAFGIKGRRDPDQDGRLNN